MIMYWSKKNINSKKYWFHEKRYGWGWGLPSAWQGWIIYFIYIISVVAGLFIFPPEEQLVLFLAWSAVSGIILFVIWWAKGEPICWRLGKDENAENADD